jgi:histidinol phosphatase-like PHP family hydrolase
LPSELVRRAATKEYGAIAITDHADYSNMEHVILSMVKVAGELNRSQEVFVIPGVEITHVPPSQISGMIEWARELGAEVVIVHGESPVEPVARGTNRSAIEACADILAHPGFILETEVAMAAELGVYLEITARGGHNMTNGHVAKLALSEGAKLVVNTDAHGPSDLIDRSTAIRALMGAGLTLHEAQDAFANNEALLDRIKTSRK